MRFLVFDTETTCKYPDRANIVQLAYIIVDLNDTDKHIEKKSRNTVISSTSDNHKIDSQLYTTITTRDMIVRPGKNVFISPEATAIHKISHRIAMVKGIPLEHALETFFNDIRTHKPDVIIAHNMTYDATVVKMEADRCERSDLYASDFTKHLCTMKSTTDFCKLSQKPTTNPRALKKRAEEEKRLGHPSYKWPKNDELYEKLFGSRPDHLTLHNALDDVMCTAVCAIELYNRGIISTKDFLTRDDYLAQR